MPHTLSLKRTTDAFVTHITDAISHSFIAALLLVVFEGNEEHALM